jgi:hypothetical protein
MIRNKGRYCGEGRNDGSTVGFATAHIAYRRGGVTKEAIIFLFQAAFLKFGRTVFSEN